MGLLDFITGDNKKTNPQANPQNTQPTNFSPVNNYSAQNPQGTQGVNPVQPIPQRPQTQFTGAPVASQNPYQPAPAQGQNPYPPRPVQQGAMPNNNFQQPQGYNPNNFVNPSPIVDAEVSDIHAGAKTYNPADSFTQAASTPVSNLQTNSAVPPINATPYQAPSNSRSFTDPLNTTMGTSNSTSSPQPQAAIITPTLQPPAGLSSTLDPLSSGMNGNAEMDDLEKSLTQSTQNSFEPSKVTPVAEPVIEDLNDKTTESSTLDIPEVPITEETLKSLNLPTSVLTPEVKKETDPVLPKTESNYSKALDEIKVGISGDNSQSRIDSGTSASSQSQVDSVTKTNILEPSSINPVPSSLPPVPNTKPLETSNQPASSVDKKPEAVPTQDSKPSTLNSELKPLDINSQPKTALAEQNLSSSSLTSTSSSNQQNLTNKPSTPTPEPSTLNSKPTSPKKTDMFKKIALLGLNGPKTDTNLSNQVKRLAKKLAEQDVELIIDSKSGLGEFVVQATQDIKKKYSAVMLKPFLSSDNEQPKQYAVNAKGSTVLYSNYIEKVRHLVKESRMFIFFNGGGLSNLSTFTTIWTIASMYKGQNKPIILFGENWKNFLDALKVNTSLQQSEMDLIFVAKTADEALEKIEQLKQEYSSKPSMDIDRVVDRRIEGDEKDFILY